MFEEVCPELSALFLLQFSSGRDFHVALEAEKVPEFGQKDVGNPLISLLQHRAECVVKQLRDASRAHSS